MSAKPGYAGRGNIWYDLTHMSHTDIPSVAELYRSISVHEGNYMQKLLPGDDSFEQTGGMFIIHNERSLKRLLDRGDTAVTLIKSADGAIQSMLWYSLAPGSFRDMDRIAWSGDADREDILRQREGKRLGEALEIIVSPHSAAPMPAAVMILQMLERLKAEGFDGVAGEIYKILSFSDRGGEYASGLFNHRSFNMLKLTGLTQIGRLPPRALWMPGFTVVIEPTMGYWAIGPSMAKTRKLLEEERIVLSL